jgi:hypothetical protein
MGRNPVNRRDVLRSAAAAAALGSITEAEAQHVHQQAAEARQKTAGVYKPQLFNAHEFQTLGSLADRIIPPEGAQAGGAKAGAAEYIDVLAANNSQLAEIYLGGLAWLDHAMESRTGKRFLDATPAQQSELLDLIAYRKNATGDLGPGVHFFDWARRMVVDAWVTSPAGVQALGYQGNTGMTEFQAPREAIEYALKRSPFRE